MLGRTTPRPRASLPSLNLATRLREARSGRVDPFRLRTYIIATRLAPACAGDLFDRDWASLCQSRGADHV